MKLHPQFVTDTKGACTGVILSVEDYRRLMELVEDHLDAADLDTAVREAETVEPYDQVRAELGREGRL